MRGCAPEAGLTFPFWLGVAPFLYGRGVRPELLPEPAWAPVGVRLTIEPIAAEEAVENARIAGGTPNVLRLTFGNGTNRTMGLWELQTSWVNYRLVVRDQNGKEPPLTPFAQRYREAQRHLRVSDGSLRMIKVKPGVSCIAAQVVVPEQHYTMRPGIYQIAIEYSCVGGFKQDPFDSFRVRSNWIPYLVR